jgi:hypothetical protein
MALAGKGAVIIRFDRPPGTLDAFYDWMIGEHMPERLSIPGFLLGRRFRRTSGPDRFLTIYEVEGMHVLRGPHYLERLNNPTPLTRRTQPQSTNLSRGDTAVELSLGVAQGGAMCTLGFGPHAGREAQLRAYLTTALHAAMTMRGVLGAHLYVTDEAASRTEVEERKGRHIAVPAWIVLVEGVSTPLVERACDEHLSREALRAHGAADAFERESWVHEMTLPHLS